MLSPPEMPRKEKQLRSWELGFRWLRVGSAHFGLYRAVGLRVWKLDLLWCCDACSWSLGLFVNISKCLRILVV